ncbi:MAG: GNAT family N-acetyltransferase [Bacteroidetes bacterium]|nr:GNAT family N-acetyltransferase [Bacteroidota bacterium]
MKDLAFPELHTERLILRQVSESDVAEIFFLRSDERQLKYLDKKPATSTEEALTWIRMIEDLQQKEEGYMWAICLKNNPKLIGTFCFWNIQKENFRAEIGYSLHPDFQGKGIMDETIKAALDFGFKQLKFHSVEANVNPANEKSIQLLQRNNFVKEAHFKENYYFDGKFIDSAIYSLLASVHLK